MVNPSKIRQERFWKLWGDSGAIGTVDDAFRRELDKIRALYRESGGRPHYPPTYRLNPLDKSKTGCPEMDFDYGVPHYLYTSKGSYTILGSNSVGDTRKFWRLLTQAFRVEVLVPKRDDTKFSEVERLEEDLEFQLCTSGPYVKLMPA